MKGKIEFCGVPGAGKSTLSERSISLLKKRGYSLLSREEMLSRNIAKRNYGLAATMLGRLFPAWRRSFLGLSHGLYDWHRLVVDYPEFVALFHKIFARVDEDEKWRSTVFNAFLTSAFEHQLNLASDCPVVFDESFSQRCFTLLGYRPVGRNEEAIRYGKLMPLPKAVIWVATDPEVCLGRLHRRDHFPILLDPEKIRMLGGYKEWNVLFGDLVEELMRRGTKVLKVEGVNDLDTKVEFIADFLQPLL